MPAKLEQRKVGLITLRWNTFPSQSQIEYNMARGGEKVQNR